MRLDYIETIRRKMKLHELSNNKIALEKTLKMFKKTEETDDGYITWCDGLGKPHLQVNMYNQIVYILTEGFKNLLDLYERVAAEEERKKRFDPFYLNPERKDENLHTPTTFREEKTQKKRERLHISERVYVDGLINTAEYLEDYQRDILLNSIDSGYVSYKHLLSENEPKYIDKYTTAYNSEIMRAILSHQ